MRIIEQKFVPHKYKAPIHSLDHVMLVEGEASMRRNWS
jgi:hypothetical protein